MIVEPQIASILREVSFWTLPLLFAITLHEAAHAWTALKLGDKTSYFLGRVSLNPFSHIDPVGTIAVPVTLMVLKIPFIFGWAKPVPINTRHLKNIRRDTALIAIAGPLSNLIMAILWAILFKISMRFFFFPQHYIFTWVIGNAQRGLFINCLLCIFNLFPIPPLDGSKILAALLPYNTLWIFDFIEAYGFILLLLLIFSGILHIPISFLTQSLIALVDLSTSFI